MIRKFISALVGGSSEADPAATAPASSETTGKRKYRQGKRRHPMPRGARKIDPNGGLIEQARQVRGIDQ